MIKSADSREDLAVLRKAYEGLLPGLYRYGDKATMDARFESLTRQFERDLPLEEAYVAFSVFAALGFANAAGPRRIRSYSKCMAQCSTRSAPIKSVVVATFFNIVTEFRLDVVLPSGIRKFQNPGNRGPY
jgi:hypothetical protein